VIGKVLKQPEGKSYDLPPRLFRQELNPFKRPAKSFESSIQRATRCTAHFWDNTKKQAVVMDLGPVWVNTRNFYRGASLAVESVFDDEPANILSWAYEGAPQYELSGAGEGSGGAADAHPLHGGQNTPGPYVIPGQVAMGCQNTPGQTPTDWNNQC